MEARKKPTFYRAIDLYSSDEENLDEITEPIEEKCNDKLNHDESNNDAIVSQELHDEDSEPLANILSPNRKSGRKIRLPARIDDDLNGEIIENQSIFNSCLASDGDTCMEERFGFQDRDDDDDEEEEEEEGDSYEEMDESGDCSQSDGDDDGDSHSDHHKDMKHEKKKKLPLVNFITGILSKKKHKSAIANHMFRNRIQKKIVIKKPIKIKVPPGQKPHQKHPQQQQQRFSYSCQCAEPLQTASSQSSQFCQVQLYVRNSHESNAKNVCLALTECGRPVNRPIVHSASRHLAPVALCDNHYNVIRSHDACPICGHICRAGKFFVCMALAPERHYYCLNHDCYNSEGALTCPHCNSTSDQKHIYAYLQGDQRTFKSVPIKNGSEYKDPKSIQSPIKLTIVKKAVSLPAQNEILPHHINFKPFRIQDLYKSTIDNSDILTIKEMNKLKDALSKTILPVKVKTPHSFYLLCLNGELNKIISVINYIDVNVKLVEFNNQTCLHASAINGDILCLNLLLKYEADCDATNNDLETPLLLAIKYGHTRMAITLMSYMIDPHVIRDKDGLTPFHCACRYGNIEVATYLLANYCFDINLQDFGGYTGLVWATESSHIQMVVFLLDNDADAMVLDDDLNTGLHWAAYCGSLELLQIFIEICILNDVNEAGDTPLHIATRQSNLQAVEFLVNKGADITYKNKAKQSPQEICLCPEISLIFKKKELQLKGKVNNTVKRHLSSDISNTREKTPIPCVNEVDMADMPTDFTYVVSCAETRHMGIQRSLNSLHSCQCSKVECSNCFCCVKDTSSEGCYYNKEGRLTDDFDYDDPPQIYECNHVCECSDFCINKVVQKGTKCRLEMFKTWNIGWGIRTMMDIKKGTYIGQYLGEYIKDCHADDRSDDQYLFGLGINGDEQFCLDANKYSNFTRFLNHNCEPNLISVNVFVDHQDKRFPNVCFFSNQFIPANTELCIDYGERFWMIKGKHFLCQCHSNACRYNGENIKSTIQKFSAINFESNLGE